MMRIFFFAQTFPVNITKYNDEYDDDNTCEILKFYYFCCGEKGRKE